MKQPPGRRTRVETQAETRRRLLEAAAAIATEAGLGEVTVSSVARAAGLTTGAVYANFEGRAELLMATTRQLAGPASTLPREDVGGESWLEGIAALLADYTDKPSGVAIGLELQAAAVRDSQILPIVAEEARSSLAEVTASVTATGAATGSGFADGELAILVMSLFAGLAQYRLLLGEETVTTDLCARALGSLSAPPTPVART